MRHRAAWVVLEAPAAELQMLEDALGHDLLGELVTRQASLAEVAQNAGRHLAQRHAEIEQEPVAVGHAES